MSDYPGDVSAWCDSIRNARKQDEAAAVYCAAMIRCGPWCAPGPWLHLNGAIQERWPKGLRSVKEKAWKLYEAKEAKP